jgi:hypothetical protein
MYYVGLDVHQKRSSICILDRDGRQVKRLEVKGSWAQVVEAVAGVPGPFSICYEASCGYGHLYEKLTRGEQDRRKIALVTTAHHLARVMAAMLRTGEGWREQDRRGPKNDEGRAAPGGGAASPPRKTAVA